MSRQSVNNYELQIYSAIRQFLAKFDAFSAPILAAQNTLQQIASVEFSIIIISCCLPHKHFPHASQMREMDYAMRIVN